MYENAFNKIERDLRAEEGIANELDYVEQTSWVLFLKYLHDLETERADRAELDGEDYTPIIDGEYRWDKWAAPKKDGEFDHNVARIGDDLIKFVDGELFPYLASFRQSATSPQTIEYKIGEVFTELRNKFRSGYILRDVLEAIDGLSFNTQAQRHELSELYETRIKRMGNAGRNGGEYYTPRPLIRAMIKVTAPKIGETIYDGAVGSAGFLCEAFDYLRTDKLSASEYETLQTKTFYGQEKKGLAYIIGIMNMVLHGIEAPNLIHSNTLNENVMDIQEKDRHDIILANPPFGGGERREVQQNFPIRTGETAYLFLQHFIRKLKAGGRAAVVIKSTFLSNPDRASVALRKELLEAVDLHTILDCPTGTFQGAGVKTVVLFFEKGSPTRDIWYYQLDPGRSLGKTDPLNDADLEEFVELQRSRANGSRSWIVNRANLDEANYDMSVDNPNAPKEEPLRTPKAIVASALAKGAVTADLLDSISGLRSVIDETVRSTGSDWKTLTVANSFTRTKVPAKIQRKAYLLEGEFPIVSQEADLINGYWNNEDDVIRLDKPVVVFGDHTRALKYIDFDFVVGADGTQILSPIDALDPRFYFYALKTIDLAGKGYARHFSHLKKCEITFPASIIEQQSIADHLDDLTIATQELEDEYTQALQDLEDLRKSLLKRAFDFQNINCNE